MTRKDYVALSLILRTNRPPDGAAHDERSRWFSIVRDIAAECAKDNPRFEKNRFLRACGMED